MKPAITLTTLPSNKEPRLQGMTITLIVQLLIKVCLSSDTRICFKTMMLVKANTCVICFNESAFIQSYQDVPFHACCFNTREMWHFLSCTVIFFRLLFSDRAFCRCGHAVVISICIIFAGEMFC